MKHAILTSLLTAATLILLAAAGHAATITVGDPVTLCSPDCDYDNVKDAVIAAASGDTVEIQPGTYTEGHIYIDKDLTVKGASAMPVIDGAGLNYTVKVAANRAVTLKNLRLDSAGRTSPAGTATFDNRGTAHLDTVHIVGSLGLKNAYGGVHNDTGALLFMENCVVSGNEGVSMGGGISNFGGLVVKNSTITGNQGNIGGGLYNYGGTAAVISSSISLNHAANEGGGYFRISGPGTVSIFPSSSFSGNTATVDCDTYKDWNKSPICVN